MGRFASFRQSRELLLVLTRRELSTKYRRSLLGWSWSMLNPLATFAIYSFVFGVLFGARAPIGENSGLESFSMFMLSALIPWNFFSLALSIGMSSLTMNSNLVRRVAFPRETLVFSNVLHALVQFSIELTLLFVVFLILGSPVLPMLPLLFLLVLLLTAFASGFALALSVLCVYFKDVTYLWGIFMQVWFFITPIVYGPEVIRSRVPEFGQQILRLNPMVHFVSAFRSALFHGSIISITHLAVLVLCSFSSLSLGWVVFGKLGRRLPEEV